MFEQNLAICNTCPFRQRICADNAPCLCTADGTDVRDHAKEGHCPQGRYPLPKTTAETIANGVAGIARAVTGTGGADDQLIQQRTSICATCEHNVLSLGLIYRCDVCGCLTWAKARNLNEKCPINKW